MDLPEDVRSQLFAAGADALRFNAPLGPARATELIGTLNRFSPDTVVDLGCGRGELASLIAETLPRATVTGVDNDARLIESASATALERGLNDRLRFEVADVAEWTAQADAALCVGASHAFGGSGEMLSAIADTVTKGPIIVGDGVWDEQPDAWCLDTFGELPSGTEGYGELAERTGWQVVSLELSDLEEWDRFEQGWGDGVRSVGTQDAVAFADFRHREYQSYRGVLGFCWAVLRR